MAEHLKPASCRAEYKDGFVVFVVFDCTTTPPFRHQEAVWPHVRLPASAAWRLLLLLKRSAVFALIEWNQCLLLMERPSKGVSAALVCRVESKTNEDVSSFEKLLFPECVRVTKQQQQCFYWVITIDTPLACCRGRPAHSLEKQSCL